MISNLIMSFMMITNLAVSDTFIANTNFEIKYLKDNDVWQLIEQKNGSEKIVIESDTRIHNLSLSFDKSYIAFQKAGIFNYEIYSKDELKQMELDSAGDQGYKLVVLDREYNVVKEIPDARVYRWSPNENSLVCIIGKNTEPGWIRENVLIINIEDNSRTYLSEKPADIVWAKHDNNIYLSYFHDNVKKYNPSTNEMTDTDYQGIYFSPTGDYYYYPGGEGGLFQLYETQSNTPIKENYPYLNKDYMQLEGWLEDSNILFDYDSKNKQTIFLNIDNGKSFTVNMKPTSQWNYNVLKHVWDEISNSELQEEIESIK